MTGPAFPALGFDPAPGSPSAVDGLAAGCSTIVEELNVAREAVLHGGRAGGTWRGPAAEAFRSATAELPDRIDAVVRSAEAAGSALRLWHGDLVAMQRSAGRLEAEASTARDALAAAAAHPDLALADRVFTDAAQLAEAEQRLASAQRAVATRHAELDEVLRRAERLRLQHAELATDLARALRHASDPLPAPGPSLGDRFVEVASWDVPAPWLRDNAHTIAALADVTGDLSTMVGLAGLGVGLTGGGAPIAAALGALSGGLSTLALGGHLAAKGGGADVPWETIAWDAVGAGTLGLGRIPKVGDEFADLVTAGAPDVQARLERQTGDAAPTIYDNLEKYWVPRDPSQWLQYVTGDGLVVPYTNAWRDGRALDVQAARQREGR